MYNTKVVLAYILALQASNMAFIEFLKKKKKLFFNLIVVQKVIRLIIF